MPLISEDTIVCLNCLNEREIQDGEWILPESDESAFTTPPCPDCGAQETLFWHDDVYTKVTKETRPFPAEFPGGPERQLTVVFEEPDPESFGARHGALIEMQARKLGRKRASKKIREIEYPTAPQPLTKAKMRSEVRKMYEKEKHPPERAKKKGEADVEYQEALARGEREQKENERKVKESHERKHKREEMPEPKEVSETVQARLALPEKDKEVKVKNKPEGEEV